MATKEEEKNKRTALIFTLVFHGILVFLAFIIAAWQAPDPPLPQYGVELNFGLDDAGSGDVQNRNPAGKAETKEQPAPGDEAPKSAPTPTPPTPVEEVVKVAPVETVPVKTVDAEAPVYEAPAPPKPAPKPVVKAEPKPQVNEQAVMPTREVGARGTEGTSKTATASNNNGDKPGTTGDQGDPRGTLEGRAMMGTPGGGGGGSSLEMSGWVWDSKPDKRDASNETGRIVFQITVDNEGELISVIPIEKTVSPSVVRFYQQQVERLTFSKTRDNTVPAPTSTGRITIIISSR
jgi:periplasmic protein TonB